MNSRIPIPQGLVTSSSTRPSPSKSAAIRKKLSRVLSSQPPNLVPFGAIMSGRKVFPCICRIPTPHGLETKISSRPSPSKSPTGPNRLSPVCRFQPPNRVPFGAIMGAASVDPASSRIPTPHGLVIRSSARPSPSKSPTFSNRLSPVCRFQPPNRVLFGAIIRGANVFFRCSRTPRPHGLENTISACPSPSKSPTGPNRLSPVCRFQPPNRVPFGAIMGALKALPNISNSPMPQGLDTSSSARPSPSKSSCRDI